jgi:hypothetical protein
MKARERFWLNETDPNELRRRAYGLHHDGFLAMGDQLIDRANQIEKAIQAEQKERSDGAE